MKFGKRAEAPKQMDIEDIVPHSGRGNEWADMRAAGMAAALQQPNPPRPEPAAPYVQTSQDPLEVGGPVPKTIGRVADLYRDIRELRLSMEKESEKVKARETELKEYIINNLSKSDDTGAAGLRYRAQIVVKDIPRAADWPKIHAYIQKTGRFDLLQKRLGEKAVMDMVADDQAIPGVEIVKVPDVSITKI